MHRILVAEEHGRPLRPGSNTNVFHSEKELPETIARTSGITEVEFFPQAPMTLQPFLFMSCHLVKSLVGTFVAVVELLARREYIIFWGFGFDVRINLITRREDLHRASRLLEKF